MLHAYIRLCLIAVVATVAAAAEPTASFNGWTNDPGVTEGTVTVRPVDTTSPRPPLGYLEYLPKGYDPADATTTWPLVVFISGYGEIGDGTDTDANGHQLYVNMTRHGPFYQILHDQWDFPAVVVAVQQPDYWNNATILGPVLDYMQANYHVDASRIYMTGLCDGAVGVLNYVSQHPGRIAAIIPIEGGSPPNSGMAAAIKDLPMWAVHCFNDPIIACTSTITWVDQTAQADVGAAPVMSTYPGYGGVAHHEAVDTDGAGLPLDPYGPTTDVPACDLANGSTWIPFGGGTTFGSAQFNTWGGSDSQPYALLRLGNAADPSAKAGLMFRDSADPGSAQVMVGQAADHRVFMLWRDPAGAVAHGTAWTGGTTTLVRWLRLQRSGMTFTGSYSDDGTTWTTIATQSVTLSPACLAGLAVTAHDDLATYSQDFADVSIGGAAPGALSDADIGSPGQAGSSSASGSTWTVNGGGSDIGDSADHFHYASTAVVGDTDIVARVGRIDPAYVVSLGKPDGVYLTQPYAGASETRNIHLQIPVGYNATAYYNPASGGWAWQRDQQWDRSRPDKRIFTMFWYQNHLMGWRDTYFNGRCWDWLFSKSLPAAPAIQSQPQSIAVSAGQPASFTVVASGDGPITYQWARDGTPIPGATTDTYSIPSTTLSDNGAGFSVTAANSAGSTTSATATLTVVAQAPPNILQQPADQTVAEGDTATFSVSASGTPPLGYQWTRDGAPIAGATSNSYTTGPCTMSDDGSVFAVVVSSPDGSTTSANATLSVVPATPAFLIQPVGQLVAVGDTATFSVQVTGSPTPALQWEASPDGATWTPIAGATGAAYTTAPSQLSDDGTRFRCQAGNSHGNATSDEAVLHVTPTGPVGGGGGGGGGASAGTSGGAGCGLGAAAAIVLYAFAFAFVDPRRRG